MKFDFDTAWKEAMALLKANLSLLAVIAGVFFFIPYAVIMVAIPDMDMFANMQPGDNEAAMAAVTELYGNYWWALLLLAIIQGIGLLAMLALLQRRASPTVGEALQVGSKSVLSYLGSQLLQTVLLVLIVAVALVPGAAIGSPVLAFLGGLIALVAVCYVLTKFSLVSPVIAIEGERNPITALKRSWRMTKGNSIRLFFFYLLLLVALVVISMVLSLLLSLVFALGGEQAAALGSAIVSGLSNALIIVLMTCILAAVHLQLSRLGEGRADDPVI